MRRKVFTKESTKQSKTDFLDIFYHVFGRFSVRGVQKHNIGKKLTSPSTFLASEEPTNYVGVRHLF
jgi:hypothetical protein